MKVKLQCLTCGKEIERWPCRIQKYKGSFCNRSCAQSGRHPKTEFKKGHLYGKRFKNGEHPSLETEFKKGNIPWNKEVKFFKIRQDGHWNWQGGIYSKILTIRRSLEYKQWRKKIFERDNYTCQICGKRGGRIEADHIFQFSLLYKELDKIFESNLKEIMNNELLWEIKNGRTLCKKCHTKETKKFLKKNKII